MSAWGTRSLQGTWPCAPAGGAGPDVPTRRPCPLGPRRGPRAPQHRLRGPCRAPGDFWGRCRGKQSAPRPWASGHPADGQTGSLPTLAPSGDRISLRPASRHHSASHRKPGGRSGAETHSRTTETQHRKRSTVCGARSESPPHPDRGQDARPSGPTAVCPGRAAPGESRRRSEALSVSPSVQPPRGEGAESAPQS